MVSCKTQTSIQESILFWNSWILGGENFVTAINKYCNDLTPHENIIHMSQGAFINLACYAPDLFLIKVWKMVLERN